MGGAAVFRIAPVHMAHAGDAYDFHVRNAQDELVLLRSRTYFKGLAEDGHLFGAWDETGPLVAIVYADRPDWSWEIGGLTVARSVRRLHIATALVRFAIAHVIVFENTSFAEPILAHVHQLNPRPKEPLLAMGFVPDGTFALTSEKASTNLPRDADGKVVADQYRFTPAGLAQLCAWFRAFDGTLEGGVRCRFEMSFGPSLPEFTSGLCDISMKAQRSATELY